MDERQKRQIERAAINMAGSQSQWNGMSEVIKDQYREDARRAAEILVQAVPWYDVEVGVKVVLSRERGALASRKYGEDATGWVARKVVENMKLSGYTVLAGPPTEMMTTPSGPKDDRT